CRNAYPRRFPDGYAPVGGPRFHALTRPARDILGSARGLLGVSARRPLCYLTHHDGPASKPGGESASSLPRDQLGDDARSVRCAGDPGTARANQQPRPHPALRTRAAVRTRYLSEREEERLRTAIGDEHWPKIVVAMHIGLDRGAQFALRWE